MAHPSFDPRRPVWLLAAALLASAPGVGLSTAAYGAAAQASEGADSLVGGPSADTLLGLGGADTIRGMEGEDVLNGNGGDDSVGGGPGGDVIHGGPGRDRLNGGLGDDTLAGDRDDDTVAGGLGADRFLFDSTSGSDVITDFDSASGDRIELPAGFPYTLADTPQGAVIQLTGFGRLLLAHVGVDEMGVWVAGPVTTAAGAPPATLSPVANPPKPPSGFLLGAIVALAVAFVGLLWVGLLQLIRGGRRD